MTGDDKNSFHPQLHQLPPCLCFTTLKIATPSQLVGQRTTQKKENSHPFSEARCACWSAPCRPPPCPPGAAHAGFCSSPSCCSASTSASRSSLTNLLTTMRSRLFRSIIVCLRHARCSQLQSFFFVRRASCNFLCKSSSVSDSCKSDCSSTRIFPFTLGCCSALALSPVQRAGRNHLPPLFLLTTCLLDTNITRAQKVLTISPLITFTFSQICDFVSFRCLHSSDIKAALFGFSPHPQFS